MDAQRAESPEAFIRAYVERDHWSSPILMQISSLPSTFVGESTGETTGQKKFIKREMRKSDERRQGLINSGDDCTDTYPYPGVEADPSLSAG
ncbi:Hypothetical protein NTJ_06645 [Nesidiocoris tenuis]|uniref:Uncharacterized protein n=1 Tax=Nesidiocoris tenuis TaxID=355587 RepID=A0ABN7ANM9_9HEMI|nr:Hypothetical protein NTJ_06645 [Nesidiocoris tenuis]